MISNGQQVDQVASAYLWQVVQIAVLHAEQVIDLVPPRAGRG